MLNLVGGSMGSSGNYGHPQQARLFVGDLKNAEKADIEAEFSTCGPIKEIWMAHNPPGFAFVEFIDRESALKALKKMNGAIIKGDKLRVEFSKNRKGAGGFRANNNAAGAASPFMNNNGVAGPTACYYNPGRGGGGPVPPSAQAPPPPHYQYPPPFATAQASFAPAPMGAGRPPSPGLHLQPGPTLADYHHGAYAAAAPTPIYAAPYGVPQVEGSPIGGGAPHYASAAPNDYYQAVAHLKSLQQAPQASAGARMSLEEYDRYYRAAAAALSQQPPPPPTDPYGQPIPTATQGLGGGAPPAPSYLGGNGGGPPLVNDYRDYYLAAAATEQQHQPKRYTDEMGGPAPPTHYAAHHMDPNMRSPPEDPYGGGMRYKYRTNEGQVVSDDYERYLRSLYPLPPGAMGPGLGHPAGSPNGAAPGGRKYSATSRYRTASPSPPPSKGAGPVFRPGGGSPTRPYSPGNEGGRGRRDESPPKYRYYDPYYDSYYRDYRHHGHGRPGSPPLTAGSSNKDLGGGGPSGGGSIGASKSATSVSSGRGDIMGMVGGDAGNRANAMGSTGGDGGKSSGPRQIKNGGVLVTNRRDTNDQRGGGGGGGGNGDYYYDDKNNRSSLNIHDGQRR